MPDLDPINLSGETRIGGNWTAGATVERWQFDQGGERLSGAQVVVEFGWRFQ